MYRMIKERRSALHRIHHVKSFTEGGIIYPELAHDIHRLLLNHYLVEHHGAAPHASAGSEFTVELRHPKPRLGEVVGRHDTRRPAAHDGYVQFQIFLELVEIGTYDSLRYFRLNHMLHLFLVIAVH